MSVLRTAPPPGSLAHARNDNWCTASVGVMASADEGRASEDSSSCWTMRVLGSLLAQTPEHATRCRSHASSRRGVFGQAGSRENREDCAVVAGQRRYRVEDDERAEDSAAIREADRRRR